MYLLEIDPPYRHAAHYTGYAADGDVGRRLQEHLSGHGSPLVAAAVETGCTVTIARVWPGADRRKERAIKNGAHGTRACPRCRARRRLQLRLPLLFEREAA